MTDTRSQWFDDLIQDIRYGIRSLARRKVFAATALSALALGIGANTAIFSVMSGVILRPFPFAAQDRLVHLYGTPSERGAALNAQDVEEFRTTSQAFETLAGYGVGARYLQGPDTLERIMAVEVERPFFTLLGVEPALGRTFTADDASNMAVAAASFWRRALGGNLMMGASITVDGIPRTIIGVMPDSFQFPYGAGSLLENVASESRTDLWILRETPPGQPRRGRSPVAGRLKPGVSIAAAESELNAIMKRLESQTPQRPKGLGVRLAPLSETVISKPVRRSLFILFTASGLVLLLACANVTNLSLVRLTMRRKEVAARVAIGANRSRLMRQFLTESLLISFAGGAAGLALAWWGTDRLTQLAATHIPRSHEAGMDWRVFIFSFGVCVATGLLFGFLPAFSATRTSPLSILNDATSHSTMSVRQRRLRDALVVAEVALAFVLGIGATLLVRELVRLRNTEMGMIPQNVMTMHIGQPLSQTPDALPFYNIAARVRQVPGVREAGFTQMLPLQSSGWFANSIDFLRDRPQDPANVFTMELRYVTPGYFRTLEIPMARGRAFTEADTKDAPPVILINETLARKAFGSEDPIGVRTSRGTIIGIVRNVRQVNLDKPPAPEIYYPAAQNWSQLGELGMSLVVKTEGPPLAQVDAIRAAVREVNPRAAIFGVKTMDQVVTESMSDFLLYLALMFAFAGLALFLAVTGTYGVISYIATARTREFAIRSALGAGSDQVMRLVLFDAMRLTLIGLACGLPIILVSRSVLTNLPVNVRQPDLVTILPVAAATGLVTLAACVIPARRAAGADPITALRQE